MQKLTLHEFPGFALPAFTALSEAETKTAQSYFYQRQITDEIRIRMDGKSYKRGCPVPTEELCYLRILHRAFDGKTRIGELVANRAISEDLLDIFFTLYQSNYPIERVLLIDEYGADDEASMTDNNSSCFNYRTISHSTRLSKHSYGMAVDINPLYNPYLKTVNGVKTCEPAAGLVYSDRTAVFPYKITHEDLCRRLFAAHGFQWGGHWKESKDYQHFEKP